MKDYDYHSLFYYEILAKLQEYRDGSGQPLSGPKKASKEFEFSVAYLPKTERFRYNYLRDKFVAERDKLLIAHKGDHYIVLMRVARHEDKAILYKKAMKYLFGKNIVVAQRELIGMMEKFYDLTIAPGSSGLTKVDFGRTHEEENNYNVDYPFQKKEVAERRFNPYDGLGTISF